MTFADLDDNARTEFVCGGCYYLSVTLHKLKGYPIYAEIDVDDFIHCWVTDPDGNAIDINRIHNGNWAKTPYSSATPKGIILKHHLLERARDLILSHPSHFNLHATLKFNN
ncbi:hypothetical protein B9J93_12665 [Vibrio sp. V17_P4S1T151]|uniref:hypothetical protein n=1 Tax=unclassified Vibrio TaxID=2614977 RepID=UPI000B8E8F65|nr:MULTISPECIES: hypothetical protein [unclassified Vibrio]OXX44824.1 hypothetical protein B9J93_12665 [Vibrio sp. V17_P4S1T151]OXX65031.1 hypothetical protein B9J89_03885 [Vibrio sp. V15_P4S5T153]